MNLQRLYASIGAHEGTREKPYPDSKKLWTVGRGTCLETNPITGPQWKYLLDNALIDVTLSEDGMDYLVSAKVQEVIAALEAGLRGWDGINDVRQNCLIEFGYQVSRYGVLGFPKMKAAVERGDWKTAAKEGLDSKWARVDSPNRAREMMRVLESGEWPQ
jgi:lysozyme